MSEETAPSSPTLLSRLAAWFGGGNARPAATPGATPPSASTAPPAVPSFDELRQDLESLHASVGAVRAKVEEQSQRHDELLRQVTSLPDVLRTVPDQLGAIDARFREQSERQDRMDDVLARMTSVLNEQQRTAQSLATALDSLAGRHDELSAHLARLGGEVSAARESAEAGAQAARRVEENVRECDTLTVNTLHRETKRIHRLFVVVVVLLVVTLLGVGAVAYAVWRPVGS